MALVVKPVSINRSTYLRVPREMEELIDLTEKTAHKPLWIRPMWMEKELAA